MAAFGGPVRQLGGVDAAEGIVACRIDRVGMCSSSERVPPQRRLITTSPLERYDILSFSLRSRLRCARGCP